MKYKVGDRVKVKSLQWFNENSDDKYNVVLAGGWYFSKPMSILCGKELIIKKISHACNSSYYIMEDNTFIWTDEMIEGLVEEMPLDKAGQITDFEYDGLAYTLPDGYQFKDENGNVINATKIVLEKKKKEYPKTYEESVDVLGGVAIVDIITYYYSKQLIALYKLLICRDAYWKIAGEEMGLGKPWELSIGTPIYYIYYNRTVGTIKNDYADDIQGNIILAFPTAEMRDAFYENFEEDIEFVKELL